MVLLTTATIKLSTKLHCHGKSRVLFSAVEKITRGKLLVKGSWHRWGLLTGHTTAPQGAAAQTRWLLAHPAAPLHSSSLRTGFVMALCYTAEQFCLKPPVPGKLSTSPLDLGILSWLWPAEIHTR